MSEQRSGLSCSGQELRQRAEQLAAQRQPHSPATPIEQVHEVLHELAVHQIELEMQNESLRATQAELEQSRDRYAQLYDFAPVGYATLDDAGIIQEINLTAASMLGVQRSRLLGHPLMGFMNHGGKNRLIAHLRRCAAAADGDEVVSEVVMRSNVHGVADMPTQLRSTAVCDRQTGQRTYRTALIDLSELRQSQQQRHAAEENFAALADNMLQLAWMANEAGWIFWYNRRWYEFSGHRPEHLDGWGWRNLVHPEHVTRVVDKLRRHLETGEQWEDTFPLRSQDGSYRWFLARAVPIVDPNGHILRWFGTNTDITERLQMEQQLKEADRRKDVFLATLAHELRNPLAPIRSGLELLRIFGGDPATVQKAYSILETQTSRLVRLVEELLDVSRISRGVVQLHKVPLSLGQVLETALRSAAPLVDAAGQTVALHLPDQTLRIDADPVRLTQMFCNLIHNAVQYTRGEGQIELEVAPREGWVDVHVRDCGIGIRPDKLEEIFQMFVQSDTPTDRLHGGLGIGLTLCRSLVELHGGSIRAYSEGPGKGSDFVVTLPLIDANGQTTDGPSDHS